MLDLLKAVIAWLSRLTEAQLARAVAYVIAPGAVLLTAGVGVYSPEMGFTFSKPVTVAELRATIDSTGQTMEKSGLVLFIEPEDGQYSVPLKGASTVWTSLDEGTMDLDIANPRLSKAGLTVRAPFTGRPDPVTVVVDGRSSGEIYLRGEKVPVGSWRKPPTRSLAVLSDVLLVCMFAFGMSISRALSFQDENQDSDGKQRTSPDEQ